MIRKLVSDIEKDFRGLVHADKTKPATLSDVVTAARTKTVDLTGKKLGSVGGALSKRIPLKNASGVKGFFTEQEVFNDAETMKKVMDTLRKELPDSLRRNLDVEYHRENFFGGLSMYPGLDIDSESEDIREQSYNALAHVLSMLNGSEGRENFKALLKSDKNFAEAILGVQKQYFGMAAQREVSESAGISNNSRLDQRNSAMSDVAALLGMSDILAKSTPMKIIRDGKVVEGTFMENASGEDIGKLTKDSIALEADAQSFNHPTGLKKLADLQILDYICGNVDRHERNIIYQFERDGENKVVLKGICGIDNDTSFGTKLFENESAKEIAPLSKIRSMSMSCYETLKNLSPDALRVLLADKLRKEEIDAVCKRVELLTAKADAHEINLVEDKEWGTEGFTYDKICSDKKGISGAISNALRMIDNVKSEQISVKETKTELDFTAGKDVTNKAEVKFEEIFQKVNQFIAKSEKATSLFHKNSEEYEEMIKALKEVQKKGISIQNRLSKNQDVSLDEFKEFAGTVVNMGSVSQEYIDAKNQSQFTGLGRERMALAKEMRDLAQENFAIKETPMKETAELKEPEAEMER